MAGATYLCFADDNCPRHGKFIYFCHQCHLEWEEKNPNTVQVLRRRSCTPSDLVAARKKDRELRESTAVEKPVDDEGD